MDDVIVTGAAGIIMLYAGLLLIAYGAIMALIAFVQAIIKGDFHFVAIISAVVITACGVYLGIGWWLQKTGRI